MPKVQTTSTKNAENGLSWSRWSAFWAQQCLAGGAYSQVRRRTCWCWQVPVPHPPVTGQVHDQIFIDGIHLSGGWVLLIARDREHVLEWQWAANESAQAEPVNFSVYGG